MNPSEPFIRRPVATTLLTIAVGLAGAVAYNFLPVSPLPQVDFPTINVSASLPGASPETMASSVAQPLETQFAQIPGVAQMTSTSALGSTSITIQFDLDRSIDGASNDVQAAIKEESQRRLRLLPPAALNALQGLIGDPKHRDHYRAVASIVDRVSPPQQNIAVHHVHETPVTSAMILEVEAKIAALAKRAGVLLPAPSPVVDAEFSVVSGESS